MQHLLWEGGPSPRRPSSGPAIYVFLVIGSLRYGDYGLRTTAGRALSFVRSTGLSRANIERSNCTTDSRLREKRRRGKQNAKIFLFSSQFTKMQVSFACDLIFRTMNKFFHTWRKQLRTSWFAYKLIRLQLYSLFHHRSSGEIDKQSFGCTGFIFFPPWILM